MPSHSNEATTSEPSEYSRGCPPGRGGQPLSHSLSEPRGNFRHDGGARHGAGATTKLSTTAKFDGSLERGPSAGRGVFGATRLDCMAGSPCALFTMSRPRVIVRAWQR